MLNSAQAELYQRLQDFELDDQTHEFGFTRHLMKNHGWTLIQTQRAICEYKKFAFLAVVADHQVVPSDRVDQVWHAHVLLTQSYWEEFCPKVLGQKLHHHPARGGKEERAEFHVLYAKTIASYRHFFGSPPTDIWSSPDRRFGAELKMQRINVSEHWVIPKKLPQLHLPRVMTVAAIIIFTAITFAETSHASSPGMFFANTVSNEFFVVITLSITIWISQYYWFQIPDGKQKPQLDIYQIAYLAGGRSRAVELAIVQLVKQGYLFPNVWNRTFSIEKLLPSDSNRLEQQLMLQVRKTPDFTNLRKTVEYKTDFLRQQLEQKQLLLINWQNLIRYIAILLTLLFLLYGTAPLTLRIKVDVTWIPCLILLVNAICFISLGGRTRLGSSLLTDIQKSYDIHDATVGFAIHGYQMLSGGALDDLKQIFQYIESEKNDGGCGCGC
jgi:uncharacterized protein (TIGR04222 family)